MSIQKRSTTDSCSQSCKTLNGKLSARFTNLFRLVAPDMRRLTLEIRTAQSLLTSAATNLQTFKLRFLPTILLTRAKQNENLLFKVTERNNWKEGRFCCVRKL